MNNQDKVAYPRLKWQCRRGMLELDLMLQVYLDNNFSAMTPSDKLAFATLLETSDPILYDWCMGQALPENESNLHVIQQIRTTTHN